jgi:nicotinic acid mononucleotide adenylyltransferase
MKRMIFIIGQDNIVKSLEIDLEVIKNIMGKYWNTNNIVINKVKYGGMVCDMVTRLYISKEDKLNISATRYRQFLDKDIVVYGPAIVLIGVNITARDFNEIL